MSVSVNGAKEQTDIYFTRSDEFSLVLNVMDVIGGFT